MSCRSLPIVAFLAILSFPAAPALQEVRASGGAQSPSSGVVRLPLTDFNALLERLQGIEPGRGIEPPVDAVAVSAAYRVVVDAEQRVAVVQAEVALAVLRQDRWIEIPLLSDSAAIDRFTVDGRPATLTQADGTFRLVFRAAPVPGRTAGAESVHKLEFEYRANVAADGGPRSAVLPIVGAAINRIEVRIPRTDQEIRVLPDGVVLDRSVTADSTRVTALAPRTAALTVRWADRAAPAQDEPLRAVAETLHRVAFQRHVASGEVAVRLEVQRGAFEALVLRFPKEAEGIRADDDVAIDIADGPDGAQLATARLGYARREDAVVTLRYEMGRVAGRVVIPDVKVVGMIQDGHMREAVRQSGFLAVLADDGMEVVPDGSPEGAEPCDPSEVPGATRLRGVLVMAFRTSGLPHGVPVSVTRHEERPVLASAVQSARLAMVVTPDGKAVGTLELLVQNNERQFVGVDLPQGATLWAAFADGRPVKPSGRDGWVMVPVPRSGVGPDGAPRAFQVDVIYYQRADSVAGLWGSARFAAPAIDMLVSRYDIDLWMPDDYRYFDFGGDAEAAADEVEPTEPVPPEGRPREAADVDGRRRDEETADTRTVSAVSGLEYRQAQEKAAAPSPTAGDDVAGRDVPEVAARPESPAPASRGLLPIRIDVPRTGLLLSFHRTLVESKEAPAVDFRYQSAAFVSVLPWVGALAGLLLGLAVARLVHRSARARRLSVGRAAPAAFACGT
ncbi:MAG: hypothetical protein QME96_14125, partial [Myxococcota bacterium]|nr:hypothetical protein [Myxococcota bacterium]